MAANIQKDTQKARKEVSDRMSALKAELDEINQLEQEQKQAAINQRKIERGKLLNDAKKFRDDALVKAQKGDLESAKDLRQFADDAEGKAREIVIDGEAPIDVVDEKSQFGEGMSLTKILLLLALITLALTFFSGWINFEVQKSVKNISISLGAEWVHAIQNTQFWSLCWFFAFAMMYVVFRSVSRFINPRKHLEFDLTTKLFTECSVQYQISVSLLLLLSMVFSWVLMYLHNPVANS